MSLVKPFTSSHQVDIGSLKCLRRGLYVFKLFVESTETPVAGRRRKQVCDIVVFLVQVLKQLEVTV
jgi:hypothetical protein